MREIKFRAWDDEIKKMRYGDWSGDDSIWGKETYHFLIDLAGRYTIYINDDGGKSGLWEHEVNLRGKEYILMQYTGLKDKNGKEVYEGDVVRFLYYRKPVNSPIAWGTDGWWVSGKGWFKTLYEIAWKCEIIGNIMENPELVKEKL